MRVLYVPVSEKAWISHFQQGGFIGARYQRGAGLGSIFRSLFRAILPVAKSAGKSVGRRALKAGAEIASDLVSGRNFKESLQEHGRHAASDLLSKAATKLKGGKLGTIKRPKKTKRVIRKKRTVKTQLGHLSI